MKLIRRYLLFLLCGCALPTLAQFRYHGGISGEPGLNAPSHVIVSPDDRYVYVAGSGDNTIAVFARNQQNGGLIHVGEATDGQGGVEGLAGVRQLAISADGRFLYAVADQDHALSVFSRGEDGQLTFIEAHQDGQAGVDGLGGARALAISPDDDNIYVAAYEDHAVAVFSVDGSSGRTTFEEAVFDGDSKGATKLNTANSVAVSPDGQHVYVTGLLDDGISVFSRSTAQQGALTAVQNVDNWALYLGFGNVRPTGIAISPDGKSAYVTGYGGSTAGNLTHFARDLTSGQLSIVQRFTDDSSLDDRFIRLQDFGRLTSVALTPDQDFVFTTGDNSPSADDFKILSFTRNLNTGSLETFQGIKNNQGGVTGLETPRALAFSQDGNFFYVVSLENALTIYSFLFPEVINLTPREGFPGEEMTITGTDFGGKFAGDTVMFGGTGARVKNWSNEEIIVYVPEMEGGVTNVVVTVNGQSSTPQDFEAKSTSLRITQIEPSRVAPGNTVTITGENFGDGEEVPQVFFDETAASTVVWLSATSLTAVVPEMESGMVSVRIEHNDEQVVSAQALTVDKTPPQPTFSPGAWASGVATDATLEISFSEPIAYPDTKRLIQDGDEVPDMVSLRNVSDDSEAAIAARYESATSTIRIDPVAPLDDNRMYELTLFANTVVDDLGNLLKQDTTIRFKTGSLRISDGPNSGFQDSGGITYQAIVDGTADLFSQLQVHYRGICDEGNWQDKQLATPDSDGFEYVLPTGFADPIGVEYYYSLIDRQNEVQFSDTTYQYLPYDDGINISVKAGNQSDDYEILSVPITLDDQTVAGVMNELGGYNKEQWRLFTVGPSEQYQEYPAFSTLESGKGYLLLSRAASVDRIHTGAGQAVEVTKDTPFKIPVHPGWNLIGNPYPFDVAWEAVVKHPDNDEIFASDEGILFDYGNNWDTSHSKLLQKRGGLVNLSADADSLAIPIGAAVKSSRLATTAHRMQWNVELSVRQQSGTLRRTRAGFGMHPEAQVSWDRHDRATPPPLGRFLDINFHHPEHFQPYFARDVVPVRPDYQWDFEVATSEANSPLVLHWSSSHLPRDQKQLLLWDLTNNRLMDMRAQDTYTFPAGATRPFRILYGDELFVEKHLQPTQVSLSPAYPNPLVQQTTLPFAIPATERPSQVIVTIYQLSGRRVVVLKDEPVEAGLYQLLWDGTDAQGRRVSSGVYLAELRVQQGSSWVNRRQRLVVVPR